MLQSDNAATLSCDCNGRKSGPQCYNTLFVVGSYSQMKGVCDVMIYLFVIAS